MKRLTALIAVLIILLCSCSKYKGMFILSEGEKTESAETVNDPEETLPIGSLELISMTDIVENGQMASVTVKGLPNTEYDITVTYSSVSEAGGLENKVSDGEGYVSWSWRVGSRTKAGLYPIEIMCESEKITLYFEVVPKE